MASYPDGMNLPHRSAQSLVFAALVLFATGANAQTIRDGVIYYPGAFTMEVGKPGELPPPVTAAAGQILHSDKTGGANQSLKALAGGQAGFSAIWSDTRDGNLGLYFGQLGVGSTQTNGGLPLHAPRSSRQVLPDLAQFTIGHDSISGGVVWTAQEMNGTFATLRLFDSRIAGEKTFTSEPISLDALDQVASCQLSVLPSGIGVVAWLRAGVVMGRSLARDEELGTMRPGGKFTLTKEIQVTGGSFHLAINESRAALLAWNVGDTIQVQVANLRSQDTPGDPIELGEGRVLEICDDATSPDAGWWALIRGEADLALLHIDSTGKSDRPPIVLSDNPVASADLCKWADGKGIALVVEKELDEGSEQTIQSRAGSVRLHLLDALGEHITPPQGIDALDADARDARWPKLAATGDNFLVAWTDSRRDNADVFYRHFSLENPFQEAHRWNNDVASSDQAHAALAASGAGAVAVWEDGRNGVARIIARTIQVAPGAETSRRSESNAARTLLLGDEIKAAFSGAPCAFPSVAVAEDQSFLVTWKEKLQDYSVLRGQVFGPDGHSRGPATDLDTGNTASAKWPAALVALPRNAGYMITWTRSGAGPVALRLDPSGRPTGQARSLTDRPIPSAAHPDLCALDDGRLVAVWDQLGKPIPLPGTAKEALTTSEEVRVLSGRFLDATGQPHGGQLFFAPSPNGGDLDPSVAPLRKNSNSQDRAFLLVWTGNDGPVRDVFARAMDAKAQPAGPPMAISVKANEQDYAEVVRMPNGELYISWEDDISGRDHCFVRRVSADGAILGPTMLINETATAYVEDRHAALLAPLITPGGPGLLAIWDDLARSKGHDVFGKWIAQEEKPLR